MPGIEQGGSPEEDQPGAKNEYADLDAGRIAHVGQAEVVAHGINNAGDRLAAARDHLNSIQTGELTPIGGVHAGWEKAMDAVDEAQEGLDSANEAANEVSEVSNTAANIEQPAGSHEGTLAPEPELIGEVMLDDGRPGQRETEPYREAANATLAKLLEDPDSADEFLKKAELGKDYGPDGISDVMAATALPFFKKAEQAEANGRPEQADMYRKEGALLAHGIGRGMNYTKLAYAIAPSGAEMSINGARVNTPNKTPNAMKALTWAQKRGISVKAIFKRK